MEDSKPDSVLDNHLSNGTLNVPAESDSVPSFFGTWESILNIPFGGCSGGDCPFHFSLSFREKPNSSLLLSRVVNSTYVPAQRATSPWSSTSLGYPEFYRRVRVTPYSAHPAFCCLDFPPAQTSLSRRMLASDCPSSKLGYCITKNIIFPLFNLFYCAKLDNGVKN